MHESSIKNVKNFISKYLNPNCNYNILDVGSQEVPGEILGSYKSLFQNSRAKWNYVGMDITPGYNVDVAVKDPYKWKELSPNTFDVVVCGQVFEHNEYFWLTMFKIRRVLKNNGLCCIIAPSSGPEHRYPVDCYRFYPDGMKSMAHYAGLDVLEVFAQWNRDLYPDMNPQWRDCVLVCRKVQKGTGESLKFSLCSKIMRFLLPKSDYNEAQENDPDYSNASRTTYTDPSFTPTATRLYLDIGNGFNEKEVLQGGMPSLNGDFFSKFILPPSCRQVRFDPIEGRGCVIGNLIVQTDSGIIKNMVSNGTAVNNSTFLYTATNDPQLFLNFEGKKVNWITIQARINFFVI